MTDEHIRAKAIERASRVAEGRLQERGPRAAYRGSLIAQGDSWFDYRGFDLIERLSWEHGFRVYSAARRGRTAEELAYQDDYIERLRDQFESAAEREDQPPMAILLSAGGNDLLGSALAVTLNHQEAALRPDGLNDPILTELLDRIDTAYKSILTTVTLYSCDTFQTSRIPIIVHGYDYPIPDGRKPQGLLLGLVSLLGVSIPGPWLQPAFEARGYDANAVSSNKGSLLKAVNKLNSRLQALTAMENVNPVYYVDFRTLLGEIDATDPKYWADEIHPNRIGFGKLANCLVRKICECQVLARESEELYDRSEYSQGRERRVVE